jgi:hypothetical protein
MESIATGGAAAFGATAKIDFSDLFAPLVNNSAETVLQPRRGLTRRPYLHPQCRQRRSEIRIASRRADGKVDGRTFDGFRRYNAGCNHRHAPDGIGSTFAPSLVDRLVNEGAFRRIVFEGRTSGTWVMPGYASDPNFAPYVDDILQARADGKLGRGRLARLAE